ncbi:hypothetical protein HOLleu_04420 [Holothuria leucospilota]|uniref:Uncharacterized protein n=1 Tax=Holothuria leucospilota TaxID=206669 RepID=A0A9Q1HI85_HOLLE|nr:hypothetical protein HOLleu_04420 [Holothuria leucospilota]
MESELLLENKDISLHKIPCDNGWIHDQSTFPSTIIIDVSLQVFFITVQFFYSLFLVESPLWLLAKQRFNDAEKILQKMATCNGKNVTEKILQPAKETTDTISS